jgi:squalene synthase HpnC
MTNANPSRSGKTHREENFPVASLLVRARHRPIILAFYYFVRAADDVADSPTLTSGEKIERLDRMEAALLGDRAGEENPQAVALRRALGERGLSPRHAQDLLEAFRLDAVKRRYADWNDLISYCALSAMPVGRFVLDVHGESPSTWPASDAVCAALQIINHLQDCGEDYRDLDRVYLPLDVLARHGAAVEALGANRASPGLRSSIAELAGGAADLLREGEGLIGGIADWRLRAEISVIHALAMRLTRVLAEKDPLGEETHLSKWQAGWIGLPAAFHGATRGFGPASRPAASGSRI